jgi:transcriptional regulator with XRE-family HTH domain
MMRSVRDDALLFVKFGEAVRRVRKAGRMSQDELAKKTGLVTGHFKTSHSGSNQNRPP